jgi:hypothetical protein
MLHHAGTRIGLRRATPQDHIVTAQDTSLTLGSFHVDGAGRLLPIEPGAPPKVTFRWLTG